MIQVYHWNKLKSNKPKRETLFNRSNKQVFSPKIFNTVRKIAEDVRKNGDEAIYRHTLKNDGVDLKKFGIRVEEREIKQSLKKISKEELQTIKIFIKRTERYNQLIKTTTDWQKKTGPGEILGIKATPIESIGLYVPCGKGIFPSTLITGAVPAIVAGVKNIDLVIPPTSDGRIPVAYLAVANLLGIKNIFRANGVAGVAAMGFGTKTIPKVRKIVGPGSPYVMGAQLYLQLYGTVVATLFGPTEAMILADETSDPDRLALDILSEAEHGPDSAVVLVINSEKKAIKVREKILFHWESIEDPVRKGYLKTSLGKYSGIIVAKEKRESYEIVNDYAAEHLQISTKNPEKDLKFIDNAAEILLSQNSPFAAANYIIGVPATLPTGGFAKVNSGVNYYSYVKFSSIAKLSEKALQRLGKHVESFSKMEGFYTHGMAVTKRF